MLCKWCVGVYGIKTAFKGDWPLGMTSSPANLLSDLNMHWQKSHYHIQQGFLYCLWWIRKRGKFFGSSSQLAAQLESFGDLYTKKLSLIIKFSDCSCIDLFRICISTFSPICFLLWKFSPWILALFLFYFTDGETS